MKKFLMLIMICFFTIPLAVYASNDGAKNNYKSVEPINIVSEDITETYENMCVDIGVNGDGYYSLMSDVEINYVDNEIGYIYLDEPTLLSYVISSKYGC